MELRTGYKQTEVGIIPEDWDVKPIEQFTNVTSGGTPSTLIRDYWNGTIRWMNSGELNLKIVLEVENRITELGLNNSATKLVPENCVLIGLAGQGKTRGTVAINKVELCTNQSIAAILPSDEVFYKYLYYNLDSRYYELRGLSTGDGGRGGLNLTIIKNLLIPLPPTKAEQTAIAAALSDMDDLIKSLSKLIEKKKAIKQGVMQELLKPKEGWVMKKLGEVGEIVTGSTPPTINKKYWDGTIPWITPTDIIEQKDIDNSERKITEEGLKVIRKLPSNSLLVTCIASIGKNAILRVSGSSNQQINAIIPNIENDVDFLYYLMELNKQYLIGKAGITATLMISKKEFAEINFVIPKTKEEQISISKILSDIDTEIQSIKLICLKYQLIKQGMMQELLTGKTRLV